MCSSQLARVSVDQSGLLANREHCISIIGEASLSRCWTSTDTSTQIVAIPVRSRAILLLLVSNGIVLAPIVSGPNSTQPSAQPHHIKALGTRNLASGLTYHIHQLVFVDCDKMTSLTPSDRATAILCAKHLHQSLRLPATTSHNELIVTFATTTNFTNTALPAILFVGPMFGTRYLALLFNKLAEQCGVRLICVDRCVSSMPSGPASVSYFIFLSGFQHHNKRRMPFAN